MPVYRYPPTGTPMSILPVDNWPGCGQLAFGGRRVSVVCRSVVTGGRRPTGGCAGSSARGVRVAVRWQSRRAVDDGCGPVAGSAHVAGSLAGICGSARQATAVATRALGACESCAVWLWVRERGWPGSVVRAGGSRLALAVRVTLCDMEQDHQGDGGQQGESDEEAGGCEEFHASTLVGGSLYARRPRGVFCHPSGG